MRRKALVVALGLAGLLLAGQAGFAAYHSIPEDLSIGTWDAKTRTYTLTTDVTGGVYVSDASSLTFDGAGHTVTVPDLAQRAVVVVNSTDVTVRNVRIHGPGYGWSNTGIFFTVCDSCTAVDNVITDCDFGIWMYDTPSSVITGNTLSYCGYTVLVAESDYCTLSRNTVSDAYWYGLWLMASSYGLVYNNNVIASGWQQAVVDSGTGNVFSLPWPIGGNYWSGWTAPDADGDGIVDSPYAFSGGQDDAPWTAPDGWLAFGPADQILALAVAMDTLGLPKGLGQSLDAKLQAAFAVLEDADSANDGAAVHVLGAFVRAVQAQQWKGISAADATALSAAAKAIIANLGA